MSEETKRKISEALTKGKQAIGRGVKATAKPIGVGAAIGRIAALNPGKVATAAVAAGAVGVAKVATKANATLFKGNAGKTAKQTYSAAKMGEKVATKIADTGSKLAGESAARRAGRKLVKGY
jgi:hypothetical protein